MTHNVLGYNVNIKQYKRGLSLLNSATPALTRLFPRSIVCLRTPYPKKAVCSSITHLNWLSCRSNIPGCALPSLFNWVCGFQRQVHIRIGHLVKTLLFTFIIMGLLCTLYSYVHLCKSYSWPLFSVQSFSGRLLFSKNIFKIGLQQSQLYIVSCYLSIKKDSY